MSKTEDKGDGGKNISEQSLDNYEYELLRYFIETKRDKVYFDELWKHFQKDKYQNACWSLQDKGILKQDCDSEGNWFLKLSKIPFSTFKNKGKIGENFEWNLKIYAILKALDGKDKVENPLTYEKIPSEMKKYIKPEEIAGELYVAINQSLAEIVEENGKVYFRITTSGKRFIKWTEERLKEIDQENLEFQKELELEREATKEMGIDDLLNILGATIKRDDINKLITFFCMLIAYTEDAQFNVSFRAPSSTGKSYIPIELSQFFPKEDVIIIAYSSPTSFYHDTGGWDEEKKAIVIDLERKILIFLDQPHDMLLQRLRPLLSHDQKELLYKITDKGEKKGLRTKNVIIRGFPSVIFCTGSLKVDEQEATRNFILSPETTMEKIRESIFLKALRKGNPPAYENFLSSKIERKLLQIRIQKIKEAKIKHVVIRDVNKVCEDFIRKYPKLKPRHQRDIERLISLIQGFALFNFWNREKDEEGNIYANDEDIKNAFELFDQIAESQELGIPPYIYNLFKEVIEPLYLEVNKEKAENPVGLTRKQIINKHFEVYGRPLQDWYLRREILPALESAGLIIEEPDPNDRRRMVIHITTPPFSSLFLTSHSKFISEKNREQDGGVTANNELLKSSESDTQGAKGKEELTSFGKLERDMIEIVKNSPLRRSLYDFEIEAFLVQRGYKEEDIRKVMEGLIKSGVLIRTPDDKLDINFLKS
jgi:hypothetical protein